MNRRTEITIETSRRLVIRRFSGGSRSWCAECSAEVWMITPTQAAVIAEVSSRTIYRWIEEGKLHFTESLGVLLVCDTSLTLTGGGAPSTEDRLSLKEVRDALENRERQRAGRLARDSTRWPHLIRAIHFLSS